MTGMFDDLLPRGGATPGSGLFEDLVPVTDFSRPDAEIRAAIRKLPANKQQVAQRQWADYRVSKLPSGMVRQSLAKGIPLIGPFLDEAVAGVQSGLYGLTGGNLGQPYDEALEEERAKERRAFAESPVTEAVGRLATGIATGGPIFGRLAPAATTTGRIGQGAVVGGGVGAVEGFGAGEGGVGQRMTSAGAGATVGAGLGAALPIAAAGITRGYGAVADNLGPAWAARRYGPEEAADQILARSIAREGSSPAAKRLDLQQGQAYDARMNQGSNATLPETLADTSDAMRRLTGSLYRQGGEAGNFIRDTLTRRQRGGENLYARTQGGAPDGQMARVMDATERAMLIRSSGSAFQTERQIMQQQAAEGRRLYDAARQNQDPFDLDGPVMAMSLVAQQYPRSATRRQIDQAIRLFTGDNMPTNDIRRFDNAKKALDDMISRAQRAGENNLVRELTGFRQSLLDAVHAGGRNQAYQAARDAWGSAAENREAIDLGRAALRDASEVSVEQYRALTRGQQQLFRIGFLESLRNALRTRRPGNDVTQLLEQQRVRELMREIVPATQGRNSVFRDRPERFGNVIRREQRMVQTNNAVMGNSATAQRQADDIAFSGETLAGMWDRFRQAPSLFNMGIEAVGVGIQRVFGYRQDVALALAQRLLEANPQQRNQILRRLRARGGPDVFARFAELLDRSAIALAGSTVEPMQLEAK